jgi:hypothetical protein
MSYMDAKCCVFSYVYTSILVIRTYGSFDPLCISSETFIDLD